MNKKINTWLFLVLLLPWIVGFTIFGKELLTPDGDGSNLTGVILDDDVLNEDDMATGSTTYPPTQASVINYINALTLSENVRIDNYTMAEDNFGFWNAPFALTITAIAVRCHGTCSTPATIILEDGSGNAMTHNAVTVQSTDGSAAVFTPVTAANTMVEGELLRIDNTQVSQNPETDEYIITLKYTRN